MRYSERLSNKIIQQAIAAFPGKLNISALARALGVSVHRLWFYINSERKWTVEAWLAALVALGRAEIKDDCIIIKGVAPTAYTDKFLSLKHADITTEEATRDKR